ncbi:MAG: Ppx/GppA family phosphatase [Geminicoccaceae bacterium]
MSRASRSTRPPPAGGHVAVIDIGSNSIRLVVYDRLCRSPVPRFNEKALCGLGRGLESDGTLDATAREQAALALRRFVRLADAMDVRSLHIVATEAVRRASDGPAFLVALERQLGRSIAVLSGDDEARLSALGVAGGFWQPDGIVADLGGGSLEFAEIGHGGLAERRISLPLGTLRLPPNPGAAAARHIEAVLDTAPWLRGAARGRAFYVVGGGWRALARIHLAVSAAPLGIVHGHTLDRDQALEFSGRIARTERKDLAEMPGVPRRRLETLPAAALLFRLTVERLEPATVTFSALGLREGVLFAGMDARARAEDPLLAGAEALGKAQNRSPDIGPALLRWIAPLPGGDDPRLARLRAAACHVSDMAWLETPGSRARDAFFNLAHYPFLGVSHAERAYVAHAVFSRYDGDPEDRAVRQVSALLTPADRRDAEQLGRLLQLAYRVSGGVPTLLDEARLSIRSDGVRLELADRALAPEPEAVASRLRQLARSLGIAASDLVLPA